MNRLVKSSLLLLVIGLLPTIVWAGQDDLSQAVEISADSVEINDAQGMSVYKGRVIYTQGRISLHSDILTIYLKDKQLSRFVAEGQPAIYRQWDDVEDTEVRIQAQHIEYFAENERMVLEGEAHVWRAGDEFSGHFIEYLVRENVISAVKGGGNQGRAQIILQPHPAKVKSDKLKPTSQTPDDKAAEKQ